MLEPKTFVFVYRTEQDTLVSQGVIPDIKDGEIIGCSLDNAHAHDGAPPNVQAYCNNPSIFLLWAVLPDGSHVGPFHGGSLGNVETQQPIPLGSIFDGTYRDANLLLMRLAHEAIEGWKAYRAGEERKLVVVNDLDGTWHRKQ